MRILFVTTRFPYPPVQGDAMRVWRHTEYLHAQGHEVYLACVNPREPAPEHLAHVRQFCREVAVVVRPGWRGLLRGGLAWLGGGSLTMNYFAEPRLARQLAQWSLTERFDAVLVFSTAVAGIAAGVAAPRHVLDMCDVESDKWRRYAGHVPPPLRWAFGIEARRLLWHEQRWARRYDATLLVNERERAKFERRVPGARAAVLRTALHLDAFDPPTDDHGQPRLSDQPIIGMVGSMFYPPNVRAVEWFGRHVWPRVRARRPDAEWWIVGNRPANAVRRRGSEPGVQVTGFVPEVTPYLHRMRVYVCPVTGDLGLQTKVVIAMAAGRPCVVTPDVAAGIDGDDSSPFLIASAPDAFAQHVLRLLEDDGLARRLAAAARETVRREYEPLTQLRRLEEWLRGVPPRVCGVAAASSETLPNPVQPVRI